MNFSNLDELKDAVEQSGGVLTVPMQQLRDAFGAERLGTNVRYEISESLKKLGLAHQPKQLPAYQSQPVRIYLRKSPAGKLIRSVRTLDPEADKQIRRATNAQAQEIIEKIRLLVQ